MSRAGEPAGARLWRAGSAAEPLALIVAAVAFARISGAWALTGVAVAALVASIFVRARAADHPLTTRFVVGASVVIGGAIGTFAIASPTLPYPWPTIALAAIFGGAAWRWIGAPPNLYATALPGLVVLTVSGETNVGTFYTVIVIVYVGLLLVALRNSDAGRPPVASLPARRFLIGGSLLALAAAGFTTSVLTLPPLSVWSAQHMLDLIASPETGFTEHLFLDSLSGMRQSDDLVLRVYGAPTDYLRGAIFDRYETGRWTNSIAPTLSPARSLPLSSSSADRVRISIVGGGRDRYFLPLNAHAVVTREHTAGVDRFGVLRAPRRSATSVSFQVSGAADLPPPAPTPDDLVVPDALRATLDPLVAEWTRGASTKPEKVAAIVDHLRNDFTYALEFRRTRRDALVQFLTQDRRGHCEYFASALALAARSIGVPARVAAGYRVTEQNPLGGYHVVRERDAHAWVEVYFEGRGFVTVDGTPDSPLGQGAPRRTGPLRAILDVVGAAFGSLAGWLAEIKLVTVGAVLLGVAVVGAVVRYLQRRTSRRRLPDPRTMGSPPPASLLRLLRELERKGMVRAQSESIEAFALRLKHPELSGLLSRVADLRYGGLGDPDAIYQEVDRWAERLQEAGDLETLLGPVSREASPPHSRRRARAAPG